MACKICGKSSCTRAFHSLESQEEFDNIADNIKERMIKQFEQILDDFTEELFDNGYVPDHCSQAVVDLFDKYLNKIKKLY